MKKNGMSRRYFLLGAAASGILTACGGGSSTPSGGGGTPSGGGGGTPSGGGGTPSGGGGTPSGGGGSTPPAGMKFPLTIDLSSANLPTGPATLAYAYIIGGYSPTTDPNTQVNCRLDASGGVHQLSTQDNTIAANTFPDPNNIVSPTDTAAINETYPAAWANYSIPLSVTGPTFIELGNLNAANLPGLGTGGSAFSGRIYISLGVPLLPFTVIGMTSPTEYSGPSRSPGAVGSLCLYDFLEFSIDSTGAFNLDTSYVDGFGLPLNFIVQPGGALQGELNISSKQVLEAISAFDPSVYAGLTQTTTISTAYPFPAGSGTNYLRAISPDKLASLVVAKASQTPTPGPKFMTYFDSVISSWDGQSITVTDSTYGTYVASGSGLSSVTSGGVVTGTWTFNYVSGNNSGNPAPQTLTYTDVTTANIWQCAGTLTETAQGKAQAAIGNVILTAFNRGLLSIANPTSITLSDVNCPSPSTYYDNTPSNFWSESFHKWSSNGLCYGFAYDDDCAQSSDVDVAAPTGVTISLGTMF